MLQWRRHTGEGCQEAATACSTRCQEQPTVIWREGATERTVCAPRTDHMCVDVSYPDRLDPLR
jgi:hypothetical protein